MLFDPDAPEIATPGDERTPLQVYRRDTDGAFVRVLAGAGPLWCAGIDAFLVVQRDPQTVRLRIARDASGQDLVPSVAEARDAAEARVRELEARLRDGPAG